MKMQPNFGGQYGGGMNNNGYPSHGQNKAQSMSNVRIFLSLKNLESNAAW